MKCVLYHWRFPSLLDNNFSTSAVDMQRCSQLVPLPVTLPHRVEDGPRDAYVEACCSFTCRDGTVESDCKVSAPPKPDSRGDFFGDIDGDNFSADFVHVFTTCRLTLELVRDIVCSELSEGAADDGYSPIRLVPHVSNTSKTIGASYYRSKRAILFYVTSLPSLKLYSCRAMDIAVHEVGHAILDAIKPQLYEGGGGGGERSDGCHASAIHEAFADVLWILFSTSRSDWCHEVLRECQFNLDRRCRANEIGAALDASNDAEVSHSGAEGPGESPSSDGSDTFRRTFLHSRSALNCGKGAYGCASVFVAFIWDVLAALFARRDALLITPRCRESETNNDCGEELRCVSQLLCHIVVRSLCRCSQMPSFGEWLKQMTSDELLHECIKSISVPPSSHIVAVIQEVITTQAQQRSIEVLGISRKQQRQSLLGSF